MLLRWSAEDIHIVAKGILVISWRETRHSLSIPLCNLRTNFPKAGTILLFHSPLLLSYQQQNKDKFCQGWISFLVQIATLASERIELVYRKIDHLFHSTSVAYACNPANWQCVQTIHIVRPCVSASRMQAWPVPLTGAGLIRNLHQVVGETE